MKDAESGRNGKGNGKGEGMGKGMGKGKEGVKKLKEKEGER